jgi:hypothetical protein
LTPEEYYIERWKKFTTFGAIIDPFKPVHGHSGILPVEQLKLQPWMWQGAFAKMNTFLHTGPLFIGQGVLGAESVS